MKCPNPNCGANLADNASFCNICGAKIERAQGDAGSVNTGYKPPKTGNGWTAPVAKKNIAVNVLLTIITCGIYGLVWFAQIINDLNTAYGSEEEDGAVKVVIFSVLTLGIYRIVWFYKAARMVDEIRRRSGKTSSDSALLFMFIGLFSPNLTYAIIQSELNDVAAL